LATIKDVQEVFRAIQHNPVTAFLKDCSFHERLMLASLVKCMKREGIEEIKWGEVSKKLRLDKFISYFLFCRSVTSI